MTSGRKSVRRALSGHAWTVFPQIASRMRPPKMLELRPWSTVIDDADVGPVPISGEWHTTGDADALVILVHGLGGQPSSFYCRKAAATLSQRGYDTLNLALRGADRAGTDYYNVGQTADLHAAIAAPDFAQYARVFVLGFSMGGHVGLHLAADVHDARLRGVAAICSPLHLASAQRYLDGQRAAFYRHHVLRGLADIYAAVAERRPVPNPVEAVRRARCIYDWDRLAICPRYGFRDPAECYEGLSVHSRLDALRTPALLVASENDPMIERANVRRYLPSKGGLELRWAKRAGHLSFTRRLALGFGSERGLIPQVCHWFEAQ